MKCHSVINKKLQLFANCCGISRITLGCAVKVTNNTFKEIWTFSVSLSSLYILLTALGTSVEFLASTAVYLRNKVDVVKAQYT